MPSVSSCLCLFMYNAISTESGYHLHPTYRTSGHVISDTGGHTNQLTLQFAVNRSRACGITQHDRDTIY